MAHELAVFRGEPGYREWLACDACKAPAPAPGEPFRVFEEWCRAECGQAEADEAKRS